MTKTFLSIDQAIISNYPGVTIGYMVVKELHHVASFTIPGEISMLPQMAIERNQLTIQNLTEHPSIAAWRTVYQQCNVKPKTYKSSIESLMRRFLQKDYRPILPVVDFYNFVSAGNLVPIGGYNLGNLEGEITLRYGRENDKFTSLSGKDPFVADPQHIVYADNHTEEPVICWMWNQKDSKRTMLTNEVKSALFIFDGASQQDKEKILIAQQQLSNGMQAGGATVIKSGILDREHPVLIG